MTAGRIMAAADYDRFAVVAFATPAIVEAVEAIRRQLPPSGRPILPAHVTIKGTFVEPRDLDAIGEHIQACCAQARPFTLETAALHGWADGPYGGAWLAVAESEPLAALHWRLVQALRGLCTTTYHGEDTGQFRPHLTVVQQIPAEQVDAAVSVIGRFNTAYAFSVSEAALVGRRGGTRWETLSSFPIGTAVCP